jgi:hypothetical protein
MCALRTYFVSRNCVLCSGRATLIFGGARTWEQVFPKFKMATTSALVAYDSDSSDEEKSTEDLPDDNEPAPDATVDITALKSKFLLNSAPVVTAKVYKKNTK